MMSKRKKRTLFFILVIIAAAIIIIRGISHELYIRNVYREAENLIAEERYKEAETALWKIVDEEYKDTRSLLTLCGAHEKYDSGDIEGAWSEISDARFLNQSPEQIEAIREFTKRVGHEYSEYVREKMWEEVKSYRDGIRNGVPYVGMPESEIGNTSLGAPSPDIRHNNAMKNGKSFVANLYDFKNGNHVIFTARCVDGEVTEVWDSRSSVRSSYTPQKKSISKESDAYDDPYNVNDYSDPEDFYLDYYDDFWEYDEAEEYWNEHHE